MAQDYVYQAVAVAKNWAYVSSNTQVSTSAGTLHAVITSAGNTTSGVLLYDSASGASNEMISIVTPDGTARFDFDVSLSNGLYVVISGSATCMVIYS